VTRLSTPVVVIVFNRPEHTAQLFEALRTVRPATLFVVADGPRPSVAGDAAACRATRAVVEAAVDWPCDVVNEVAEENLGCACRVVSGLDAVFAHVDRAIILEDDVFPNPSFFAYCDAVLERYADDERVGHVAGRNPLGSWRADELEYFFAPTTSIWGWATWRRAWSTYDQTLERYRTSDARAAIAAAAVDAEHATLLSWLLECDVPNRIGEWDVQWSIAQMANGRLSVIPARNLVTNGGFGPDATHTFHEDDLAGLLRAAALDLPPRGPAEVAEDREFEIRAVQYERLRSFRDARLMRLAAGALQQPEVAQRMKANPAVTNALAALRSPALSLDVLRRVHAHSARSEHLDRLVSDFSVLAASP
jgi:hypothetical protein